MFQILVVEDDKELRDLFCTVLSESGYHAIPAENGLDAFDLLESNYIDLIISDVMMPKMDGFEMTRLLRESGYTMPVLMITAKENAADKREGFRSGTDDYMVKPIDVNEMVWRVEALLRRSQIVSRHTVKLGDTELDSDTFTVHTDCGETVLPQKEFLLLFKLVSSPNRIFTRRQIMDEIWGPDSEADTHTLDVHISRLREKFKGNPDFEIVTVRGLGYKAVKKMKLTKKSVRITVLFSSLVFVVLTLTMVMTVLITLFLLHMGVIPTAMREISLAVLAVASIIIGTLLSHVAGKRPLNVIREIDSASREVVKGNFDVRLNENIAAEELRSMAKNFNTMVRELSKTEIFRTDFIENVSHEFKTPLSAIEGYTTLLQNKSLSEEKRLEYTNRILINTRRLSNLTGNILLLSRLENQELEITKETFSLDEQLREVILLFENEWTKKDVELDIDLCAVDYTGNRELLMQVWQNIFGNAMKFVPEHGLIRVLLSKENENVKVAIVDNGKGMSEEVMTRIYEKFYQEDSSRTGSGNGLGLALAKRITDLHGGTITVSSKVGRGTAFTVTLPL